MPNPEEKEDQGFGTFQEGVCVASGRALFYLIIIFWWRCIFFLVVPLLALNSHRRYSWPQWVKWPPQPSVTNHATARYS